MKAFFVKVGQIAKKVLIFSLKAAAVLGLMYGSFYVGARSGYQAGFRRALPIGACYGYRNTLAEMGIDANIECTPIPPELRPTENDQ